MVNIKTAHRFFNSLQERYPLPEGVEVAFFCENKPRLEDGELGKTFAWCVIDRVKNNVKITIAVKRRKLKLILQSVGHEYYHAIQWFHKGEFKTLADGIDQYIEYEAEAEGFGFRQTLLFLAQEQSGNVD
jgi:hypothetical protein